MSAGPLGRREGAYKAAEESMAPSRAEEGVSRGRVGARGECRGMWAIACVRTVGRRLKMGGWVMGNWPGGWVGKGWGWPVVPNAAG